MIIHISASGRATNQSKINKLYKYMTLDNAIKVLSDSYLRFSYPASWNDPYEKKALEGKYIINNKNVNYPIKDKFLATCFTEQYSCEAQWKMYSYNKRQPCVEFIFNKDKLLQAFEKMGAHVFIGKVEYCSTKEFSKKVCDCFKSITSKKTFMAKNPLKPDNLKYILRPMYIKRQAFAYENEWRVILTNDDIYDSDGNVSIPNLIDCIEGIVVGPCKDYNEFQSVKSKLYSLNSNLIIHESYINKDSKRTMTFCL